MNCGTCLVRIANLDQLFFFTKSETEVHLSLRPECKQVVVNTTLDIKKDGKKERVFCKKGHPIGVMLPFGPDGTDFVGFGKEKVDVCDTRPSKVPWKNQMDKHPQSQIEKRDMNSFFGSAPSPAKKAKAEVPPPVDQKPRLCFASDSELENFRWDNGLLKHKTPRDYQIQAYIECLRQNLIVSLRTGAGKTLIAAMVMKRMRELNPDFMGLMLVDRVPLVFQQSRAIQEETGLITIGMCGENRTQRMIDQLKDGTFDCLIATAGLILELLNRDLISLEMFSCIVVDECHHTRKGHVYNKILDFWRVLANKPRILALSASPFQAETIEKGLTSMKEFQSLYENAVIYHPDVPQLDQKLDWITVPDETVLPEFKQCLFSHIRQALIMFQRHSSDNSLKLDSECLEKQYAGKVRGELSALLIYHQSDAMVSKYLKRLSSLFETADLAPILGIKLAAENLTAELPDLLQQFSKFKHSSDSPRLTLLEQKIQRARSTSKILVFVDTRSISRLLKKHLADRYPHMNPLLLVGHGGFDGMGWEDEQEAVLDKFREGKSRLIVCTSVLEEGLDVSECDLVIRFCGVASLIKFIQSKGRARKENSRFVVFLAQDEKDQIKKIENQERIMRVLLERYATERVPSAVGLRIKQSLDMASTDGSCMGTDGNTEQITDELNIDQGGSIELYFNSFASSGQAEINLKNAVYDSVPHYKLLKPKRIVVTAPTATATVPMLSSDQTVAYVYLTKQTRQSRVHDSYNIHCSVWDFKLTVQREEQQVLTRYLPHSLEIPSEKTPATFLCQNIDFGKMNDFMFSKSDLREHEFSDIKLEVTETKDVKCSLKCTYDNYYDTEITQYCIHIDHETLGRYLLRSTNKDIVSFYLCLSSTPILTRKVETSSDELNMEHDFTTELSEQERFERVCGFDNFVLQLLAKNPVIRFQMTKLHAAKFEKFTAKSTLMVIPIYDTRITTERCAETFSDQGFSSSKTSSMQLTYANDTKFDCLWNLCILATMRTMWISDSILNELQRECQNDTENYFKNGLILSFMCSSIISLYQSMDLMKEFTFLRKFNSPVLEPREVKNCFMVKRLLVTPSHVVYKLPVAIASNRLLRMWSGEKQDWDLVVVSFVDEKFEKLSEPATFPNVEAIIRDGLYLLGRKYVYLCASASQLRDHKAYFVHPPEKADQLRDRIITNRNEFKSVAKYSSRLGLFCTADTDTGHVSEQETSEENDIETLGGECVTDGAGKISLQFARHINETFLKLDKIPAALQIRYAGKKGILVTDFSSSMHPAALKLTFRPSMHKFQTDHTGFGYNNYSKYAPLKINREIITLLDALKPQTSCFSDVLMKLQEEELQRCIARFRNIETAIQVLSEYLPQLTIAHIKDSGLDILQEPFWLKLLQTSYKLDTVALRSKTKIPLKKGALLMGIPDPIGALHDNQVFLRISPDNQSAKTIEGDVLVFRNPCLHPGDVRKVKAVDIPCLSSWENVVIFPAGLASFSMPAQCSGGDLDGDKFAVVWEQDLVDVVTESFRPLDYANLDSQQKHCKSDDAISNSTMASFFVDVISNDALGRVAHMHLAISDRLPRGATDNLAIELAKSQSVAVDFPKTGVQPTVPKDAKNVVSESGYPDFMEKAVSNSYCSEKSIGQLYRKCCSSIFDKIPDMKESVVIDESLLVLGYENFVNDGRVQYRKFQREMSYIIFSYDLRREHELFFGQPVVMNSTLGADFDKAKKIISAEREALREKYRQIFFTGLQNKEVTQKASAWYFLAYMDHERNRCLSFPWLVIDDILCSILKKNKLKVESSKIIHEVKTLGISARHVFLQQSDNFLQVIQQKSEVLRSVRQVVDDSLFKLEIYGSVSQMLCTTWSDVDICAIPMLLVYEKPHIPDKIEFLRIPEKQQENDFLNRFIFPRVDKVAISISHVKNARVPVIKLTMGAEDNPIDVDIAVNMKGFKKTQYMHYLYANNMGFFNALWVMVRWARNAGIVKLNQDSDSVLPSAEFYLLAIKLCFGKIPKWENVFPPKNLSVDETIEGIKDATGLILCATHHYIEQFFTEASKLGDAFSLEWPVESYVVEYSSSNLATISNKSTKALHCLTVTSDVAILLEFTLNQTHATNEIVRRVPRALAIKIAEFTEFHAIVLSAQTGATVKFEKEPNLTLRATGSAAAIHKLQLEFTKLSRTHSTLSLGHIPHKTSRYFIEGSTLLLVQQAPQDMARLSFKPSSGPFQTYHTGYERSIPVLTTNRTTLSDWKTDAAFVLANHIKQQLSHGFPRNTRSATETLHLSARYGSFYALDTTTALPATNRTLQLGEMKAFIEKAKRSRRKFERGEFKNTAPQKPREKTEEKKYDMVKLNPIRPKHEGGAAVAAEHQRTSNSKTHKTLKKGLASSFCPGMFVNNVVEDQKVLETCWNKYVEALEKCGYKETENPKPVHFAKITIVPSQSYVASLTVNEKMDVLDVEERRFNWAHVTILNGHNETPQRGQKFIQNHDIRLTLQNSNPIKPGQDLYNYIFPTGQALSPIEMKRGDPAPRIAEHIKKAGNERRITHTRTVLRSLYFRKYLGESSLIKYVSGHMGQGIEYSGENMSASECARKFCEMSTNFDVEGLGATLLERDLTRYEVDQMTKTILEEVLLVSQKLKNVVNSQ